MIQTSDFLDKAVGESEKGRNDFKKIQMFSDFSMQYSRGNILDTEYDGDDDYITETKTILEENAK